ncbi:peptidoglycan DD-metalloendopeptidase family protein [Geoalkalibacter sp.]|uniref:peptidoglycan DD-metalloendopeptidase family protein n=1 Tax=Geoalkalibacter sp. TaxID=3041440 RepID=UPI00272E8CEB|nr:peptidoglycan DD-metalloendopeptidase family protein [Geoalkalibacter sp.]
MMEIISPRRPRQYRQRKPRRRSRFLAALLLVLLAVWFWPQDEATDLADLEEDTSLALVAEQTADEPQEPQLPPTHFVHAIEPGDTLSSIFSRYALGQSAMYQILAADEALLALDILRPGHVLTFNLNEETRILEEMELYIHPGSRVVYRRADAETFEYDEILIPGEWEQQLLAGEINGSFYLSAMQAGLTEGEAAQITTLFREQLNFARDMQAGDQFQIIRHQQLVEGEPTGQSRIEAVRILRRNRVHSAFLCDDGNYYDHNGESLMRAFLRFPSERRLKVSSAFNPRRLHPVTGRVAPHNGTDFPMPIGTPVLATGDGVVTRVNNHPFAGKYVEIRHGGDYTTRYLHLHKTLVKQGQSVKRGERIALSGNTGRSTGPHLHFELHVRGRPVDPMRADIPMTVSVPKERRKQFEQRVAELINLMDGPDERIAMR